MVADIPYSNVIDHKKDMYSSNEFDTYQYVNNLRSQIYKRKSIPRDCFRDRSTIIKSSWENNRKANYLRPKTEILKLNEELEFELTSETFELKKVILDSKYILDLGDNWDDEGSIGYSSVSLKSSIKFLLDFNIWIKKLYDAKLYLPSINHGPKGSIDLIWMEDDFRLFINIDYFNNKGNFYSDSLNQYCEGEFPLNNIKFNLLPLPIKY